MLWLPNAMRQMKLVLQKEFGIEVIVHALLMYSRTAAIGFTSGFRAYLVQHEK
ncbi:hypothetical protein IMCC9480_1925 [Oxalobacteraceae bacterium IMCC9480]|nr:hypothetical protein IMCC9480_1925 [Oxalobacteraceae bacterium IMCC9480]